MTSINGDGALAGAPDKQDSASVIVRYISEEVKNAQRVTIFRALREGPLTTIDARELFGISSPAARIFELRRQGWDIVTVSVTEADFAGRLHRVARYMLRGAA